MSDPAVAIARPLIERFEGCRLDAYQDLGGRWTIGWGSLTMPDGSLVPAGAVITQAEADAMLRAEIVVRADAVDKLLGQVQVTDYQRAALYSLAFNVGVPALGASTLLRLLLAKDRLGAAAQFTRWSHVDGALSDGLLRRRTVELILFLAGSFPPS